MTPNDQPSLSRVCLRWCLAAAVLAATMLACGRSATTPEGGGEGTSEVGAGGIQVTPRGGPSPTPSVRVFHNTDAQEDGLVCTSGEASPDPLPPSLDMGQVSVEILGSEYIWAVSFPRVESLTTVVNEPGAVFSGGIGILDPTRESPASDPDFFFRTSSNMNFGFQWDPSLPDMRNSSQVYEAGGWETPQGSMYRMRTSFLANTLRLRISVEAVPEASTWFVWMSDGQVCDVQGIEDGTPVLSFP